MPPLSTIKFISDTLRVFYLLTGAIEISFNLRTACRQSTLRAFVYAVSDTRGAGALCLCRGLFILWRFQLTKCPLHRVSSLHHGHETVGALTRTSIINQCLILVLGLVEIAFGGKVADIPVGTDLHIRIRIITLLQQ